MMDLAREHFLAAAGLAGEQHRRRMTRDQRGAGDRAAHRGTASDDQLPRFEPLEIFAQSAVLDLRTTRQCSNALHGLEVARRGRDDLIERRSKLRGREQRRECAARRDREPCRDQPSPRCRLRVDAAPLTGDEQRDRARCRRAELDALERHRRRQCRRDRPHHRARRVRVRERCQQIRDHDE